MRNPVQLGWSRIRYQATDHSSAATETMLFLKMTADIRYGNLLISFKLNVVGLFDAKKR